MTQPKSISDQERIAVSGLPGPKRYAHVISQCADRQTVWALRSGGGWVCAQGDDGHSAFPLWPHEPYARQCATGPWADATPSALHLHVFLDTMVPGLVAGESQLAIFPTPDGSVVLVPVQQFVEDLQAELGRIE
jgi:hypothetical protein